MTIIKCDEIGGTPPMNVIFTHSKKKLKRLFRKLGVTNYDFDDTSSDATTSYLQNDAQGTSLHVVYMRPDTTFSAAQDCGLLAHEATRVAQNYFEIIKEDEPSAEFEAYVVGNVTAFLCSKHFKWKKKRLGD